MATSDPPDPPDPLQVPDLNYYEVLGVEITATNVQVKKAFKKQALYVHPDKASEASNDAWLKLSKAYEVISDQEKRADYDRLLRKEKGGKLSARAKGPLLRLPDGFRLSSAFPTWYRQWFSAGRVVKTGQFPSSLVSDLKTFMKGPLQEVHLFNSKDTALPVSCKMQNLVASQDHAQGVEQEVHDFTYDQLVRTISDAVDYPDSSNTLSGLQEFLENIINLAHLKQNKQAQNFVFSTQDGTVPILDLSSVPTEKLSLLLELFTGPLEDTASHELPHLLDQLAKYVPKREVQAPCEVIPNQTHCSACSSEFWLFHRAKYECFACRKKFCRDCPAKNHKPARMGQWQVRSICKMCHTQLLQADMRDWMENATAFVRNQTEEDTRAAFACVLMALCSSGELNFQLINQFSRELTNNGLPEMAIVLLAGMTKSTSAPVESLKIHLGMSKALESLSTSPHNFGSDQYLLMRAARMACERASEVQVSSVEVPNLSSQKTTLNASVKSLEEEDHQLCQTEVHAASWCLDEAWTCRDFKRIVNILTDERNPNLLANHDNNYMAQALQRFLSTKQVYANRMLPEDRTALAFFQGLVKINQGKTEAGLADVEIAVWGGYHFIWCIKPAVEIVVALLSKKSSSLDFVQSVREACKKVINQVSSRGTHALATINTDWFLSCLNLTKDDVNPPSTIHWPRLNSDDIHTFEEAVTTQVKNGSMSYREAALAYFDYILACQHPAEKCICFLIAGQWFLKELQSKLAIAKPPQPEVYATKEAAMLYLGEALRVSHMCMHPAMRLYVARLALGTALTVTQLAGDCSTPKDAELIIDLLDTIVHNIRFCPFWKSPVVTVSEATILWLVMSELHSQFMVELQKVPEKWCPIRQAELHYQLYENDLRGVCSLDDSDAALQKAMETLIDEKGWLWQDITHVMSSPLSLRTPDGWLQPQPVFNTNLEYAELKGFVITLDKCNPAVQLLVRRSKNEKGNPALFSLADVDSVLQLEKEDWDRKPLFFSLDPPSSKEHFHPFQELRYNPKNLQNTDFLHTLFEADYLMKSFSIGSDISAKPPFKQRSCCEGLTAGLPVHLQRAIRPVHERGFSQSRLNRFWIEADEMVYSERQINGSTIEILFEQPKMVVKSHKMFRGANGELHDTPDDDDPDSAECQFAADMTAHYDELGEHFPVFARLKELSKLQFLGVFLNGVEECMQQKAEGRVSDESLRNIQQEIWQEKRRQVTNMLSSMRRETGVWPAATDYSTVQEHVRKHRATIKSQANVPSWNTSEDDNIDSLIEPKVVEALRQRDDNYVSQIVDGLFGLCQRRISQWDLNTMVKNWLSNYRNAQTELEEKVWSCLTLPTCEDIRQSIIQQHTPNYNAFRRMHKDLKDAAKQNVNNLQSSCGDLPCNWVPAALYTHEETNATYLSYGGVMLQPTLKEGPVAPPTRTFVREKITPSSRTSKQRAKPKPPQRDYRAPNVVLSPQGNPHSQERNPQTKWASIFHQEAPPGQSDILTEFQTGLTKARVALKNLLGPTQSRINQQWFCKLFGFGEASGERKGGRSSGGSSRGEGGSEGESGRRGGGAGSGGQGGGGDGGDGGDGRDGNWLWILIPLLCGASHLFTPMLRDPYKARKFREKYKAENPDEDISDKHAAHLFPLSLLSRIAQCAYWQGRIPNPKETQNVLKLFANLPENFSIVPRKVNQSDHKKMDNEIARAIADHGKTRLSSEARKRAQEQLDYAKKYAAVPELFSWIVEAYKPLLS